MLRKIVDFLMGHVKRKPVLLNGNPLGRVRPKRRHKGGLRLG